MVPEGLLYCRFVVGLIMRSRDAKLLPNFSRHNNVHRHDVNENQHQWNVKVY